MQLRRSIHMAIVAAAALVLTVGTGAWASSPSVGLIIPRGVQRGTETVLTFNGGKLADAQEILFYSPGFEVTKLEAADGAVKATVKVAADCRLGEHVAQVRTASGISDFRTFYVGALPAIQEVEPNTSFEKPQPVALNNVIEGVVENEDVDYFVVEAKKGQRIAAVVEGMRLGETMFDPYVAILDSKRFELSAADDTPLVKQDAVAAVVAPEDGKYIIEVRESAYGGNGSCRYRVHLGTFPQPTAVYPAGGKVGEELAIRFIGDPAGELTQTIKLPDAAPESFGPPSGGPSPAEPFAVGASDAGGVAPTLNPMRVSEFGNALEQEPNDTFPEATAVAAELPLAFNGIIEKPGDVDCFKFSAKKGQVYDVECFARRLRTPLDSVLSIYRASDGAALTGDDDSRYPDSYQRFTVPDDGEYIVRVTDHLSRGGPDFVYRVEFQPVKASLTVGIPRVARYSQYRQAIFVPRGNRFATLMTVSRANFGGNVVLEPKDLPAGITMIAEPMPESMNVMPVVFEAAADAPLSGKLVDFRARHADASQNISGGYTNRADFVISAPGQSLFSWCDVDRVAVAVVDELPFHLEIVEPKVPLVRNGSMQLKIVAHKKEGFDQDINVQLPFNPPGVGSASSVNVPKGQTEVLYPLNANANAALGKWKVYALGSTDLSGAAWVSSQLATLEIADPYIQIAMERSAVEKGKQTEIFCKVEKARDFEGAAKVQLVGLPNAVTAPEMELNKDTAEFAFKVSTEAASPAGTHKSLFCQVVITENGEPVLHRLGSTELRIDEPLPAPAAAPAAPAAQPVAQAEAPKPEKRLTRLEQLRLEAKQRAEAAAAETAAK